jgi:guanosine-diphosphatase
LISGLSADAKSKKNTGLSGPSSDVKSQPAVKTGDCVPHPGKPKVQYVLMIDAGSTGSRIHVYSFNYCNGPSPTLVDEIFHQIKPGLSSYGEDPEAAAKSLDVLMEVALKGVPKEYQSCTPVAVKATAGLRLLGVEKSEAILEAVRRRLETQYPFNVVKKEGVVVMDGKDEGTHITFLRA